MPTLWQICDGYSFTTPLLTYRLLSYFTRYSYKLPFIRKVCLRGINIWNAFTSTSVAFFICIIFIFGSSLFLKRTIVFGHLLYYVFSTCWRKKARKKGRGDTRERGTKGWIKKQHTNKSLLSLSYHSAFWQSAVWARCCRCLCTVQHTQSSCDHLTVSCCCVNLVHRYS